jgi:hypothetical protein
MKRYHTLAAGIVFLVCLTGCVTKLSFSSRPNYETLMEARNIPAGKKNPIAIKWWPPNFPEMQDMQSPKGGGYRVMTPTGASLASRILEVLDVSVGVNSASNRVLRIAVFVAESKFEFSSNALKHNKTIVAASCNFEAEFILGNKAWTEKFFSERRVMEDSILTQTEVLERVWDDISLQVAKSIVSNV